MIKRFRQVEGMYIERINGQERFAYGMAGSKDLYDLDEYAERGSCPGSVPVFFDFATGEVYRPFALERAVLFCEPVYAGGIFYTLRADANRGKVTLFRYLPNKEPEAIWEVGMDAVSLYNLRVIGEEIHVISQDGKGFRCYFPERFSFPLQANETVVMLAGGKVYSEAWVEEGWDEEAGCAGPDYRYYNKLLVRDYEGRLLTEEVGSLNQAPDGSWWVS